MRTLGLENPYDPLCAKCKLNSENKNPYFGKGKKKTLIILEKPSEADNFKKVPLSGESGTQLKMHLKMQNLSIENDFVTIHALGCMTKKKDPTKKQIDCCSPRIKEIINKLKPNHIWLFGDVAIDSYLRTFYPKRFKTTDADLWSNRTIPCRVNNAWLHPMYAIDFPSKNKNEFATITFRKQLNSVIDLINEPKPVFDTTYKDEIQVLLYADEIIDQLENIYINSKYVAFDYETTGLKPYEKGHKILTVSAYGLDRCLLPVQNAISFPFQYKNHFSSNEKKAIYKIWKAILVDKSIGKIAHHMKFENLWTKEILKIDIKNWHHCTMLSAYALDERKKAQGLKFLSFCHWGIPDYDKKIKKYIEATTSNSFNKLEQVNISDLCLYNAIDAKLTGDLFIKNKQMIQESGLKEAYKFLHKGSLTLSRIEMNGLPADVKYFKKMKKKVTAKIEEIKTILQSSKEAELFEQTVGKLLDYGSPKDLRILFFDVLKLKSQKKTAKGFDSVDHETLTTIKHKFATQLLELRKYDKINSTYIDQITREINNDHKVHPFFHLHTTRTGRSSSSNPNSQNLPERNEEGKKYVKYGFRVPEDYYFSEIDFGAQEVRIAACFTKDPVLIAYINDPSTDMHRDQCKELFLLDDYMYTTKEYEKVLNRLRFFTKNDFIFPQFYGSYWRSCARSLWEDACEIEFEPGFTFEDHLKNKGITCLSNITSYKDKPKKGCYEYHIIECENKFWRKYSVFRKWQDTCKSFYLENGYVYTMFGTRRRGYLNQNKILNSGIQGTGFQCLLWTLIELEKYLKKNKMRSKIIGQIHDSVLLQTHKDEVLDVYKQTKYLMEVKIKEQHDWLIVPLLAEIESSELGGTWYEKKKIDMSKTIELGEVVWKKKKGN
jgi:uracil-DNA glycosylase family 4